MSSDPEGKAEFYQGLIAQRTLAQNLLDEFHAKRAEYIEAYPTRDAQKDESQLRRFIVETDDEIARWRSRQN